MWFSKVCLLKTWLFLRFRCNLALKTLDRVGSCREFYFSGSGRVVNWWVTVGQVGWWVRLEWVGSDHKKWKTDGLGWVTKMTHGQLCTVLFCIFTVLYHMLYYIVIWLCCPVWYYSVLHTTPICDRNNLPSYNSSSLCLLFLPLPFLFIFSLPFSKYLHTLPYSIQVTFVTSVNG